MFFIIIVIIIHQIFSYAFVMQIFIDYFFVILLELYNWMSFQTSTQISNGD